MLGIIFDLFIWHNFSGINYMSFSMHKTNWLALLVFTLISGVVSAQDNNFNEIGQVLAAGSSKELAGYLNKSIDLNIDGTEATYSKAQAEGILKRFFTDYPAEGFEINHKGASKSGLPYAIGQYDYEGGSFRVWIRLKKNKEQYLIHEMSFIKE